MFLADGDPHLNLCHEFGVLLLEQADWKRSLMFLILCLLSFLWHSSSGLSLMKPLFNVLPFPVSSSWQAHLLMAFIRRHLSQV